MSISIQNLTKKIDNRTILDNVTISVKVGEIVGFLGPNGAGKTTTLKIIAGALDFQEGKVEVCGLNVKNDRLFSSGKIGYLPENNALYEDMYVQEYLLFVAEIRNVGEEKKRKIQNIIQQVGLRKESKKKISELSKGCKQRVGIAQSLISDPEVLILDEPTSGLDPIQMDDIRNLICEIGKDRTVILSSHNMLEVKELCTRAIIIHEGRIVADIEDVSDLQPLDAGLSTICVEFEKDIDERILHKTLSTAKTITKTSARKYNIISSEDIRKQIFELAVHESNALLTLTKNAKSLDDIFRKYTS